MKDLEKFGAKKASKIDKRDVLIVPNGIRRYEGMQGYRCISISSSLKYSFWSRQKTLYREKMGIKVFASTDEISKILKKKKIKEFDVVKEGVNTKSRSNDEEIKAKDAEIEALKAQLKKQS